MNRAIISIGSNIEPWKNTAAALDVLKNEKDITLVSTSSIIRTKPVGTVNQPDFLNGAVLVETALSAEALRCLLKKVEECLGRKRGPDKSGPRTIDLDIIVWNGTVVDDDYYTREFLQDAVREIRGRMP